MKMWQQEERTAETEPGQKGQALGLKGTRHGEGHTEDVHGDPAESDQAPDPRGQANWLKLEMASD